MTTASLHHLTLVAPQAIRMAADFERTLRNIEAVTADAAVRLEAEVTFRRLQQHAQALGAGIEGRWYVRGAMSPDLATRAALDRRVRTLTRARQPRAAAALIRGWVEHR